MVYRDRLRTDRSYSVEQWPYTRLNGAPLGTTGYPLYGFTYYERITDRTKESRPVKPVGTISWKWPSHGLYPYRDWDYWYYPEPGHIPGWLPNYGPEIGHLTNPLPIPTMFSDFFVSPSYADLGGQAFNAFVAQFPTKVSIANFLYELKDLADLIPRISRNLPKTVAGGYLNLQFGWLPLISDLKALGSVYQSTLSRLEWLRATYGKTVRLGFYSDISYYGTIPSSSTYLLAPGGNAYNYILLKLIDYKGIFRANGYLTHYLKGLDEPIAEMKALAAALGLNNPLGVIWEAIPYSFVVDWFAHVSTLLNHLSIQPFEGEWKVDRVTNSVKDVHRYEVWQYSYVAQGFNTPKLLGVAEATRYNRYLSLPLTPSFINGLDKLDARQQTLLGALLVAH